MKKFLDKVADYILDNCQENSLRTAIIFPNKRTEVFLKNYLKQKVDKDFWLPEFYTTDEFFIKASGLQKLDPILIYFELFKIHQEIAGANARSIDDFLVWAPVILSDFNDIDLYLADATAIFSNLSETKAMEAWNPDGRDLTEMQQNYLAFFQSLKTYYEKLNSKLAEKKSGYTGWIYRKLAENIESLSKQFQWDNFIVIGLNALSKSEKQIFGFINQNYQVDFLWDVDEYYMHPEKFGLKQMEAGRFINNLFDAWHIENPKWISSHLAKDEDKTIQIVGIPKRIGQVKYAGQLLESVLKSEGVTANSQQELDTAVVLADEKLLVPMLNALPVLQDAENKKSVFNVTMGYPLANSPLNSFIMQWLNLLINKLERRKNNFSILHFNALLNNPIVKLTFGSSKNVGKYTSTLNERNSSYLSKEEIDSILSPLGDDVSKKLIPLFLQPTENATEFINSFIAFLQIAKPIFLSSENKQVLLKEQFSVIVQLIKNISVILEEAGEVINLKALQKILVQIIRRNEINLRGEPLSGIQIMGMLETRNLDFKNIILLSANEGIIPKTTTPESFIPFDIRSLFKLPLPKEKTDVFAYHFYRLLQRAQNITLIYNSESDELGGGEKSRFILQLKDELANVNKKIKLSESMLRIDLGESKREQGIVITKTDEILKEIDKRAKRGLSPSALNTYIQCSLQYYFSRILYLKPSESIDESIESSTFGTIIHEVLEQIYTPFIGGLIDPNSLKLRLKKSEDLLIHSFNKHLNNADFNTGKNLLSFEVAKKYIKEFISSDVKQLQRNPQFLIGLEQKLATTLNVDNKEILLKGTIDRIGKDNQLGAILLADYKTGKVEKKDLKFEDWESLATDKKYSKAFQLLFYTYLYQKNNPSTQQIIPGIYSMRAISSGFITTTLPEGTDDNDLISEFEKVLSDVIEDIFNPELPFIQTDDLDTCKWCDYKGICNREGTSNF